MNKTFVRLKRAMSISQERMIMGNNALTVHGTGLSGQRRGWSSRGRNWIPLICALLWVLGGVGISTALGQNGLPRPVVPTLPPASLEEGPPSFGIPVPHMPAVPNKPGSYTGVQTLPPPNFSQVQKGGQPVPPKKVELPKPLVFPPFPPPQAPLLCPPGVLGTTPKATAEVLKKQKKYIKDMVDAEATLDLVVGRTRLMLLKTAPKRIQVSDDTIAGYTIITPTQISLVGKVVGVTVLTMWFTDPTDATKEEYLTYHLRVYPDPEARKRLEMVYDALAKEINCLFPDSNVCLKLVGDKIAVTGFAHDVDQAAKILQIVRANAPDPRDSRPEAAKVPADRLKAGALPGEVFPNGIQPIGLEQYETQGGPNVINLLKVTGEQQVMLRVTVAEVNRAAARSIGMNFTITNNNGMAVFANNTGLIATGGQSPNFGGNGFGAGFLNFTTGNSFGIPPFAGFPAGSGGFNNLPAALDNGQIRLAISALRTLNYARSLAEPTLVTLNGQTATFQAGGQFPVPVVTGFTTGGLQGVNFVPFGVQLSFTPFITDRDRIRLLIAADVSSRDLAAGATFIGGAAVPSLSTRNFQTTVELREGQTLAVAGLIQNNLGADANRVPLFGDIPVLSSLLGFNRITAGEQELVVLITPELVHPMEKHEVPPLPGSDLFEPTDLEFYLCGRLESHYPIDFRSPVRTDWNRLHTYRQFESLYLYGPHGHVNVDH